MIRNSNQSAGVLTASKAQSSRRIRDYHDRIVDLGRVDPDADQPTILRFVLDSAQRAIDADPDDSVFALEIAEVEELFSHGRISAASAADRLGLSVRDFVAEFIFDEATVPGISDQEREALINNAAEVLTNESVGRSIRRFIQETVCNEEYLATDGTSISEEKVIALRQAVNSLPADSLGFSLRQALSVGYSLGEFVELSIFTQEWCRAGGIDRETATTLISRAVSALESAEEYILSESKFSALRVRDKEITLKNIERFSYAIVGRRIQIAKATLAQRDNRLVLVTPSQPNAAVLLYQYALWIDFDFSYLPRVEAALREFKHRLDNDRRTPRDSAYLDIAEGLVHLHNEKYNKAIVHFRYGLKSAHATRDDDLIVTSLYLLARSYLRKRLYVKALRYASWSRKRNEKLECRERAAPLEILEGYLLLLLGDLEQAQDLQRHAQEVLHGTDDFVSRGDALSFQGRLHQDKEEYQEALEAFDDAIWQYQRWDSKHRNIARTYICMADVSFLYARQLSSDPERRHQVLQLRLEAFERLEAAEEIYLRDPERNHRGLGKLHNMRAFLYAASGEFDRARAETERAYFFGSQKNDHLLMGKAKKNQWSITDERRSRARHGHVEALDEAISALASAEEALSHALETDNRRLQARCYLYLGHSVLRLDRDHVSAQDFHTKARNCLTDSQRKTNSPWEEKLKRLEEAIEACKSTTIESEAELV